MRFIRYSTLAFVWLLSQTRRLFGGVLDHWLLAKIRAKVLAARCMPQAADRFFFDLADALAGELKFLADLFKRQRMFAAETEIQSDDFRFTLGERAERAFDFLAERFFDQLVIWERRTLVLDDVEEAVVFTLRERGIHGEMAAGDLQRIGDLEERHIELFGELAGAGFAFELLL